MEREGTGEDGGPRHRAELQTPTAPLLRILAAGSTSSNPDPDAHGTCPKPKALDFLLSPPNPSPP